MILPLVGGHQVGMLVLAGILLLIGAVCVGLVRETYAEARRTDEVLDNSL